MLDRRVSYGSEAGEGGRRGGVESAVGAGALGRWMRWGREGCELSPV